MIRPRGRDWSFTLLSRHEVRLTDDRYVTLATPGGSSTYALERLDDSDPNEVVVFLGEQHGTAGPAGFGEQVPAPTGYPIPEIQDELTRLRSRWELAGGDSVRLEPWAPGETHEQHLRRIRHKVRELEDRAERLSTPQPSSR